MTLDDAIASLDAEIAQLGSPQEDTIEWWLLRGKATGSSLLKAIRMKGVTPLMADTFRKGVRSGLMKLDEADSIEMAAVAKTVVAGKEVVA